MLNVRGNWPKQNEFFGLERLGTFAFCLFVCLVSLFSDYWIFVCFICKLWNLMKNTSIVVLWRFINNLSSSNPFSLQHEQLLHPWAVSYILECRELGFTYPIPGANDSAESSCCLHDKENVPKKSHHIFKNIVVVVFNWALE